MTFGMGEAKKTNKDDFSMLWGIHCLLLFFFYFFFSLGKVAASRKWRTRHKTFIKELYTSLLSHQSHFYSHLFLLSRFYHRNVYDWWCLSLSRFSTEKFFFVCISTLCFWLKKEHLLPWIILPHLPKCAILHFAYHRWFRAWDYHI